MPREPGRQAGYVIRALERAGHCHRLVGAAGDHQNACGTRDYGWRDGEPLDQGIASHHRQDETPRFGQRRSVREEGGGVPIAADPEQEQIERFRKQRFVFAGDDVEVSALRLHPMYPGRRDGNVGKQGFGRHPVVAVGRFGPHGTLIAEKDFDLGPWHSGEYPEVQVRIPRRRPPGQRERARALLPDRLPDGVCDPARRSRRCRVRVLQDEMHPGIIIRGVRGTSYL